jgi:uncharacterized protein (TIGR02217 family)
MAGDFYLEERINLCARYGSGYEEGFVVSHTEDIGGSEYSRLYHPYPKLRYQLDYTNGAREGLAKEITDLFKRCAGTMHYFRVKHYAEFTTNNKTQAPTAQDQLLIQLPAPVGEFIFQLVTWYGSTAIPWTARRLITKPSIFTVKIAIDGVEVDSSLYFVDQLTGTVHFYDDPVGVVTGGCEFDIPMRFAADYSGTFNNLNVLSASMSLIEILDGSS